MFHLPVQCRWALVVGAILVLGASAGAAEPPNFGDTATGGALRSFGGRVGATRVKIVVACVRPDPDAAARGGWVSGLAARIKDASGSGARLNEELLRKLAEQWSGDLPEKKTRNLEELLRAVPPKYHVVVREYFERLEREAKDKKK
jgi:hypothetical protein